MKVRMFPVVLLGLALGSADTLSAQAPVAGPPPNSPTAAGEVATPVPSVAPADAMARGMMDGKAAAQGVGTGGWLAGGIASGVALGLIGTGIIFAVASSSGVELPPERRVAMSSAGETPVYQQAFQQEYERTLKSRRKGAALGGGLLGTALFLLLYSSAVGTP